MELSVRASNNLRTYVRTQQNSQQVVNKQKIQQHHWKTSWRTSTHLTRKVLSKIIQEQKNEQPKQIIIAGLLKPQKILWTHQPWQFNKCVRTHEGFTARTRSLSSGCNKQERMSRHENMYGSLLPTFTMKFPFRTVSLDAWNCLESLQKAKAMKTQKER